MADKERTNRHAGIDDEFDDLDDLLKEGQDGKANGSAGADPGLPPDPPIDPFAGTEALLNSLIVECHFAMREIAIPAALKTKDALTAQRFLSDVMDIAKAGAIVGKTVAMLRAAGCAAEGGILEQAGKILPAIQKNG
jgi:hypothetical protein